MAQYYNLLSDKEAVIWIMEYAKKSKDEALKIVNGFRKSHRARGVADRMKIHAEVLPGCTFDDFEKKGTTPGNLRYMQLCGFYNEPTVHSLVSWLPVPFIGSERNQLFWEREELSAFNKEAQFPDWYKVSFGSVIHVAGMALAHFHATRIDPFNGYFVRADDMAAAESDWLYPVELKLSAENRGLEFQPSDRGAIFPNGPAFFPIGEIKALPMAELIPDGYEILDTVKPSEFEMKDLEYVSFVKKGQSPVWGKTMRQRALFNLKASFGLADAKRMMVRSLEIQEEYWNKSILFPGTRLLSSSGVQVIPRMYRKDDGSWQLGSLTIASFWQHDDVLVRLKQNEETASTGETP